MKKAFILATLFSIFNACGTRVENEVVDITKNPDYQKGFELTSKSDCFTCHKIDEKNIGPAWQDVANKYATIEGAEDMLAKKIIQGGSGTWGEIPMAPHSNFSEEDAKSIVRYILLMKK